MNTIFYEIGLIVVVATFFALLVRLFKQPPLLGYILTGIVIGPLGTRMIQNPEILEALKQIGLALLLFLVGVEMDWQKTKQQLKTVSVLGLIQIVISFLSGLGLASVFHQSLLTGVYLGLALSFSSTVIVVKVLSETRDLGSLPGRLSLGLLLFQDMVAILTLTVLNGFTVSHSLPLFNVLFLLFIKAFAVIILTWASTAYMLPMLFDKISHSAELLFISSLAWCFIFSMTLSAYGLPLEVGALLAGISLASLPYSLDIINRLRSIRDFFVLIFFVAMGTSLVKPSVDFLGLTICLTLVTVIGKPIVAYLILIWRGYNNRAAFLTSLTQSQLSEFSLILVGLGLSSGQISQQLSTSIAIVTIVSIFASTILLTNRFKLYKHLRPLLQHFERDRKHKGKLGNDNGNIGRKHHIIIFGYHRMGYHILKKLQALNHQVLVVDFNPDIIKRLKEQEIDCIYGDIQDEELLELIDADKADMIISTIPHKEETIFLLQELGKLKANAEIIVTAHHIDDALDYYKLNASYVILPHMLGGEHVAELITSYEKDQLHHLLKQRQEEIKLLKTRNHALYYD